MRSMSIRRPCSCSSFFARLLAVAWSSGGSVKRCRTSMLTPPPDIVTATSRVQQFALFVLAYQGQQSTAATVLSNALN